MITLYLSKWFKQEGGAKTKKSYLKAIASKDTAPSVSVNGIQLFEDEYKLTKTKVVIKSRVLDYPGNVVNILWFEKTKRDGLTVWRMTKLEAL